MLKVTQYLPKAEVIFFTETANLVARATNIKEDKFNNDIISIATTRDMGADAPTFSIQLTRRHPWHKYVAPNDLLIIRMWRPPEKDEVIFIGLVDDSRLAISLESGKPIRSVSIKGRGVGKAFIMFDIGYVPTVEAADPSIGWLGKQGIILGGQSPSELMDLIWEKLAKKYCRYTFSKQTDKDLFDVMTKNFTSRPGAKLVFSAGLINYQGNLWNLMKEISDIPFHELFWEVSDGKPVCVLRPTPFNSPEWGQLPQTQIYEEEVVTESLGRNDLETYSLYSVSCKSYFGAQDMFSQLMIRPLYYPPYLDKYGIRRLHAYTMYTAYADASDSVTVENTLKQYTIDLYNWNVKNNAMFNGMLLVKGSNRFKVGTRAQFVSLEDADTKDKYKEFYIRAVNQNFVNFGYWHSTLALTRGSYNDDRFSVPVGAYQEFTGWLGWGLDEITSNPDYGTSILSGGDADYTAPDPDQGNSGSVVFIARGWLIENKIRYKWAGYSTSGPIWYLDCSSFIQYLFKQIGVSVPRTTFEYVRKGGGVGTRVTRDQLQPGDIILFKGTDPKADKSSPTHIGLYTGDGKMIHNSSSKGGLVEVSIDTSYWKNHLHSFRRIL